MILTPGHTEGGICLFIDPRFGTNPEGAPVLISGDTLFCGSIGRTDFQGGDMNAMRRSLKRLAVLPDETVVLPGTTAPPRSATNAKGCSLTTRRGSRLTLRRRIARSVPSG